MLNVSVNNTLHYWYKHPVEQAVSNSSVVYRFIHFAINEIISYSYIEDIQYR